MKGLVIECEGGACPYQAYGRIDGYPCYFRSRGEAWSFRVRMDKGEPIDPIEWNDGEQWTHVEQYGPWPSAGYITKEEAHTFMEKAIQEFRNVNTKNANKTQ